MATVDPYEWLKDVGPGWESLVRPLIDRCVAEEVEIAQVKEKFGGLRFYVTGDHSCSLAEFIEGAEKSSFSICEFCGQPGTTKGRLGRGWLKTLCEPCRTKDNTSSSVGRDHIRCREVTE